MMLTGTVKAVLDAAADFDLYRNCKVPDGQPSVFRTRSGQVLDTHAVTVAVAGGLMGQLADPELLDDGAWAQRLDLSTHGLDYYLAVATSAAPTVDGDEPTDWERAMLAGHVGPHRYRFDEQEAATEQGADAVLVGRNCPACM